MWKTTTKARNKKTIIVYYVIALIFVSIGLYLNNAQLYVVAVAFLLGALFRKYWLMKRLKD
jgi:heme O synthase-like polyprenyltransferase|tara:strand:- start:649 stop:831 length:183 start_codon:yes stop_codon:yes gene_type:complete